MLTFSPAPVRQTEDTWAAWSKTTLPDNDKCTLQLILWKKLALRDRLRPWLGDTNTGCPIDGVCETITHATRTCLFLTPAFDVIAKCFSPLTVDHTLQPGRNVNTPNKTFPTPLSLLDNNPDIALSTTAGLICFSAIITSWSIRSLHFRNPLLHSPTWDGFLASWSAKLQKWTQTHTPPAPIQDLTTFPKAIRSLLTKGKVEHPGLSIPPFVVSKPKKNPKNQKSRSKGIPYLLKIQEYISQGHAPVYTDGASQPPGDSYQE